MDFGFSFDDDLFDTSAADAILLAKAQRIQLARAAASTYSAKIEQALVRPSLSPLHSPELKNRCVVVQRCGSKRQGKENDQIPSTHKRSVRLFQKGLSHRP